MLKREYIRKNLITNEYEHAVFDKDGNILYWSPGLTGNIDIDYVHMLEWLGVFDNQSLRYNNVSILDAGSPVYNVKEVISFEEISDKVYKGIRLSLTPHVEASINTILPIETFTDEPALLLPDKIKNVDEVHSLYSYSFVFDYYNRRYTSSIYDNVDNRKDISITLKNNTSKEETILTNPAVSISENGEYELELKNTITDKTTNKKFNVYIYIPEREYYFTNNLIRNEQPAKEWETVVGTIKYNKFNTWPQQQPTILYYQDAIAWGGNYEQHYKLNGEKISLYEGNVDITTLFGKEFDYQPYIYGSDNNRLQFRQVIDVKDIKKYINKDILGIQNGVYGRFVTYIGSLGGLAAKNENTSYNPIRIIPNIQYDNETNSYIFNYLDSATNYNNIQTILGLPSFLTGHTTKDNMSWLNFRINLNVDNTGKKWISDWETKELLNFYKFDECYYTIRLIFKDNNKVDYIRNRNIYNFEYRHTMYLYTEYFYIPIDVVAIEIEYELIRNDNCLCIHYHDKLTETFETSEIMLFDYDIGDFTYINTNFVYSPMLNLYVDKIPQLDMIKGNNRLKYNIRHIKTKQLDNIRIYDITSFILNKPTFNNSIYYRIRDFMEYERKTTIVDINALYNLILSDNVFSNVYDYNYLVNAVNEVVDKYYKNVVIGTQIETQSEQQISNVNVTTTASME